MTTSVCFDYVGFTSERLRLVSSRLRARDITPWDRRFYRADPESIDDSVWRPSYDQATVVVGWGDGGLTGSLRAIWSRQQGRGLTPITRVFAWLESRSTFYHLVIDEKKCFLTEGDHGISWWSEPEPDLDDLIMTGVGGRTGCTWVTDLDYGFLKLIDVIPALG